MQFVGAFTLFILIERVLPLGATDNLYKSTLI